MRESTLEDPQGWLAAHAALYVLVTTALIVLNFSFLTGCWWSLIPLVGWAPSWRCTTCPCGGSSGRRRAVGTARAAGRDSQAGRLTLTGPVPAWLGLAARRMAVARSPAGAEGQGDGCGGRRPGLRAAYGLLVAVQEVSFEVATGAIFGMPDPGGPIGVPKG